MSDTRRGADNHFEQSFADCAYEEREVKKSFSSSACHPYRKICILQPTFRGSMWVTFPRLGFSGGSRKAREQLGPIRILSNSLLFFFNDLAFLTISSKSLKFQSEMFSTPTRFRHNFIFFQRFGGSAGQQKAAIRDFGPGSCANSASGTDGNRVSQSRRAKSQAAPEGQFYSCV